MRLPLSWLLEYAPIASTVGEVDPAEVAQRLTACGLEIEAIELVGSDISGVVVAEVLNVEELAGLRKPIRYCKVSTGDGQDRHVICGATNFAAGDRVPLAVPGAVLPGGFEIGARKTYGRISAGMICSARELAIGEEHTGILVLPADAPLGQDFVSYAGLRDVVFDINVTPDKGYALSVRGVARELAIAYQAPFTDPADVGLPGDLAAPAQPAYPARIEDPTACDRFILREVHGIDLGARTPLQMQVRLARSGQRCVSLAVDVTNYLMLELGQPLHAFDRDRLTGPIVVRRARPGEQLETLDHVVRTLDPDDILITDSTGPISMAGTMGGVATEVSASSRDVVIEAAHFSARGIARMKRRHRLASEASFRFERGVDHELQLRAASRAGAMLATLGGGTLQPGRTVAAEPIDEVTIRMAASYPGSVAGVDYGQDTVTGRLREVGCEIELADDAASPGQLRLLEVRPPSWRPDLTDPADLAEEVIRLEGYQNIPVRPARATAGRGLTERQRLRRSVGRALAGFGYVEVLSTPFTSTADLDRLQLPAADARRHTLRIANPLSDDEPLMRTTLLAGLLKVLARNLGRGFADVALYEIGQVVRPRPAAREAAPILRVDRAPTAEEMASLEAALPDQPLRVGAVVCGNRELAGWWGSGRPAGWQDAVEAARVVLRTSRVPFEIRADQHEPWHPGRCAAIFVQPPGDAEELLAGHAGELHPRVVAAYGLPARTSAMELDLSLIGTVADALAPVQGPALPAYPIAVQDVALTVPAAVSSSEVEHALAAGAADAGDVVLESLRLFDVYTGGQVGAGHKSLAFTLRFRAPDRTLTADEVSAARDAAVAEAARRTGAVLRGAS
jgi:phenylalanyl-tRNA synthetase beta chain